MVSSAILCHWSQLLADLSSFSVCHYSLILSSKVSDLNAGAHGEFLDDIIADYNTDVIKTASSLLCYYGDI